ncbi:MAG TPA: DNA repair protein [Roseiflexaceae bacterium]|nr:DNA repair protein [Roseiflexaceae bacterium]
MALYHALDAHFPHESHWWPIVSDTPRFEILIGAVLVQQTRWETVEAAVLRLRDAGLLDPAAMAAANTAELAAMIRPCAFQSQKAPGLQSICRYLLERYNGDIGALLAQERAPLRAELLALPRIGRETADAIMLYGGGHPLLIVDAYARRLLARLDLAPGFDFLRAPYDAVQALIEGALSPWSDEWASGRASDWASNLAFDEHPIAPSSHRSLAFYRGLHALIVEECIHHCLANAPRQEQPGARRVFVDPRKCAGHCLECQGCPLREMCATYLRVTKDEGPKTKDERPKTKDG